MHSASAIKHKVFHFLLFTLYSSRFSSLYHAVTQKSTIVDIYLPNSSYTD